MGGGIIILFNNWTTPQKVDTCSFKVDTCSFKVDTRGAPCSYAAKSSRYCFGVR